MFNTVHKDKCYYDTWKKTKSKDRRTLGENKLKTTSEVSLLPSEANEQDKK